MPYSPPAISSTGLSISLYNDILAYLVSQYLAIFGEASYLGADSPDYQDIAVRALMAWNINAAMQAVYFAMNPQTAIGTSLDLIGRLIGVARKSFSYSTASVTLSGTPGTTITNGVARDANGNYWNLASPATIGGSGTVTIVATAQQPGVITANPGDINTISTPTAGWTGITNSAAATAGEAVEPDSLYRARLLISQAKPSLTMLAGTVGAIAAVPGVTRSTAYENYQNHNASYGVCNTSGVDVAIVTGYPLDPAANVGDAATISGVGYTIATVAGDGMSFTISSSAGVQNGANFSVLSYAPTQLGPPHSITCVTEGGNPAAIAQAIYDNHGIGCLINGTTMEEVADPLNPGIVMPVWFDVLSYEPIYVSMTVHGLTGFTSATEAAIITAIVNYLNSLGIGESVVFSELYGAALEARPNPDQPMFSIRGALSGGIFAQTSAITVAASADITVTSAAGIVVGQAVTGAGVPAGTTVSGISGTTVTLSQNATASGTAALSFFSLGTADIAVDYNQAAQGSAVNVVINIV
jgi:uncharacterized phage protein gp47/JayE